MEGFQKAGRKRSGLVQPTRNLGPESNTGSHGTAQGRGGRGEHTWGVVVQDSIAHTDLQDEGSEQLLHVRQQGVGAGEERRESPLTRMPPLPSAGSQPRKLPWRCRAPVLLSVLTSEGLATCLHTVKISRGV